MIESLRISAVHSKLTRDIELYVDKKIGRLDRYVPRQARESLKTEVKLKESKAKRKDRFECEIIMDLPKARITVHEKSTSMLAAIDLAEEKLKHQLSKYKAKHAGLRLHRKVLGRLKRF